LSAALEINEQVILHKNDGLVASRLHHRAAKSPAFNFATAPLLALLTTLFGGPEKSLHIKNQCLKKFMPTMKNMVNALNSWRLAGTEMVPPDLGRVLV